ncbi:MAG: hypothetical protein ABFD10_22650 [Prolixibacteraceae bacterium]
MEKLSETLVRQDSYSGSRYHHFVYFKSPVQRLSKRMQPQPGGEQRFRSRNMPTGNPAFTHRLPLAAPTDPAPVQRTPITATSRHSTVKVKMTDEKL